MERCARTIACIVLLGLLSIVAFGSLSVIAPPPIAMRTQGHALDQGGSPLPIGTPIRTFVDGVNYTGGRFPGDTMAIRDGTGSFALLTAGNSKTNANVSDTPTVQEGATLGDTILYAAGDFTVATPVFQETSTWAPETIVTQDLHLGSAPSTPQILKIEGIVTQPAQGGDQFVFLCNPSGSTVSLADYYLERDALGTYHGGSISLAGVLGASSKVRTNLTSPSWLSVGGDALKLVYKNPGGAAAPAGGRDVVVDRVEFNATSGGTLTWEPGNTIMGDAPAPGPGRILQRDAACTDTNDPADFSLATEPGVPAKGPPPAVAIIVPSPGQTLEAATSVTFSWTVSDEVFVSSYLHVWANVTIGNETIPLLTDQAGATSVVWTTRDVADSNVVLRVDVEDPFGAHGSASQTFALTRQSPIALIAAVLIAVVLLVFLIFGLRRARKHEEQPPSPPQVPPTPPTAPATVAPPLGGPVSVAGKKVCPQCHTAVDIADVSCFFCGYRFSEQK